MINLPNLISIFRVILIPFLIDFLIYGKNELALVVFCIAGLSDALDGSIARLKKQTTALGTFLDPMADKLLIAASFITLAILGKIYIWLTIIVISRDVIISLGFLVIYMLTDKVEIVPSILGKSTTFFQLSTIFIALILTITGGTSTVFLVVSILTALITTASGLQYIFRGLKLAA